jgi:hypothetical protein
VGIFANSISPRSQKHNFPQFSGIGTRLELSCASAATKEASRQKGEFKMSAQSTFKRTLVAIAAALLTSTVAVSAAVGPAQVASTDVASARA